MDIGEKVVNIAAVGLAGLISDNIVKLGWRMATGANPPQDDDVEVGLAQAIVFAVLSGVLLAIIKRFTVRTASQWWVNKHSEAGIGIESA